MAPAQLYAYARSTRWRMIRLLSSIALAPWAIASADAQTTSAPAPATGGGGGPTTASETRSMDGTTVPGTAANGGIGLGAPNIRLSGFRFTASGDVSETYTTNAIGVNNNAIAGYSGSDLLTTASIFLGLHDHTPRLDLDFGYSFSSLIYVNNSSFDRVSHTLNALGRAILVPDRLLLTASAFAAPILINGLGPQAAAAANSGIRDTYGYTISPELLFRFGQFARSETTINQSGVFFVLPHSPLINQTVPGALNAPASLLTYGATERILSGPDFYRLNWVLEGTATKVIEPGLNYTSASGTANIRYAFSHAIIVTSLLGYETFTSNQVLTQTVSGPTALGGLQLSPTRDFQISGQAGWQFNSASYQGNFQYQVGARTSLVGSVTDNVETPAQRLLGNLGNLGVNGNGDFLNTGLQGNPTTPPSSVTGVSAFNPAPLDGTGITSGILRYRSENVSLIHISDRTQYRLTAFHTDYETLSQLALGISPQGISTGVDLSISRNMTPRLTSAVDVSYSKVGDLGGKYNFYQTNLSLNYLMSPVMQGYASAGYSRRGTSASLAALSPLSGTYSEAHITVGIRRQFY
jgi:uncharacterized protein (PEP-CTERM system associated)